MNEPPSPTNLPIDRATRIALADLGNDTAFELIKKCSCRSPAREAGWTVSELAEACELPLSNVSRWLKRLVEHGWIERIMPDMFHRTRLDQPNSPSRLSNIWDLLTRHDSSTTGDSTNLRLMSQLAAEQAMVTGLRSALERLAIERDAACRCAEIARLETGIPNASPEELPDPNADPASPHRACPPHGEAAEQSSQPNRDSLPAVPPTLSPDNYISNIDPESLQSNRWGEMQLRTVIELAGMTEHCDFAHAVPVITDETDPFRPDMVVNLPGGGTLAVDSKVPLDAYFTAIECDDDAGCRDLMARHALAVETHMKTLAGNRYWKQFDRAPKTVVMFLPIESALVAALNLRPSLHRDAMDNNVLIVSPTLLVGLLRTIAFGWQQEDVAANASEIQKAGAAVYEHLAKLAQQFSEVGERLHQQSQSYNRAVGVLESRLLPAARKIKAMGGTQSDDLPDLVDANIEIRNVARDELLEPRSAHPRSASTVDLGTPREKTGGLKDALARRQWKWTASPNISTTSPGLEEAAIARETGSHASEATLPNLTRVERLALRLSLEEMSLKEIGETLDLSPQQVESIRRHALARLRLATRSGMLSKLEPQPD